MSHPRHPCCRRVCPRRGDTDTSEKLWCRLRPGVPDRQAGTDSGEREAAGTDNRTRTPTPAPAHSLGLTDIASDGRAAADGARLTTLIGLTHRDRPRFPESVASQSEIHSGSQNPRCPSRSDTADS
ncbi:hypothetical protein MILUP08_45475 [Micromonospora lupini str. Lupac 08]|uniref:Uncharacterized protein n=1 Tax=Micromonospora lupini str. Lupac 08 TaxID=1150864 RepID=I0L9U5_9ACTN|nr:hypothetical protein MILUP08_45475 [Micromonospora lupini str. Lupac 08]